MGWVDKHPIKRQPGTKNYQRRRLFLAFASVATAVTFGAPVLAAHRDADAIVGTVGRTTGPVSQESPFDAIDEARSRSRIMAGRKFPAGVAVSLEARRIADVALTLH